MIDDSEDTAVLVAEYMPLGPVMKFNVDMQMYFYTSESTETHERRCVRQTRDMMQGLRYLHSKGICHRDIKPDNLLLNESGRLCISDFGSAQRFPIDPCTGVMDDRVHDTRGTPCFWAPESLQLPIGIEMTCRLCALWILAE